MSIEKLIQENTEALRELTDAIREGGAAPKAAEPDKKQTPARGSGSSTGTAPKKGTAAKKTTAKKRPASSKTEKSEGGTVTRQQINDLVTKLAALDRETCGETLEKYGKARKVREIDEKHFPQLAKGLRAAIKDLKDAEEAEPEEDFDETDTGEGADDELDFEDDGNDADLDFDDSDFD